MPKPTLISATPWHCATDVQATMAHYIDVLGFQRWFDPTPNEPTGGVLWGDFRIHIGHNPVYVKALQALDVGSRPWTRIVVQGIRELHALHEQRKAKLVQAIGLRPWGDIEYTVEDPNGQLIIFSQDDV